MTEASVAILIANWNGADLLPDCLSSAFSQDYTGRIDVLVIDNGSTDGSLELLEQRFSNVRVLRNQHNNYTAANNLGARATETELVLLLNSDARMDPGCVRILVEEIGRDDRAAGVAPKVLYPDGRLYTTGILETEDLYWFDRDQGKPDGNRQEVEEVFGLSGCCALFRRDAWLRAGGQDEDFHMYYEDVDFSLRLRELGFRLLYAPRARVTHIGHATIARAPGTREELGDRNRLLILATHYRDRFTTLAAASNWFRTAPREQVLELLPNLAKRLGVEESEMSLDLVHTMREGTGTRRWSLRRRLRKIWNSLRKHAT